MTDTTFLVAALLVLVGVVVVGAVWFVASYTRHARELMHSCDERVKTVYAVSEKAFSRIMAWAYPNSHRTYRETSGLVEGAQYRNKPFPSKDESELAQQKHEEAQKLLFEAKQMREAAIETNGVPEPMEIGTQLDFENRPAPR